MRTAMEPNGFLSELAEKIFECVMDTIKEESGLVGIEARPTKEAVRNYFSEKLGVDKRTVAGWLPSAPR